MKGTVLSRDSLAARYTRIAATFAVATTVVLGATAAFGVYSVVSTEQQARIGAYRDVLAQEVSSQLQTAYRITRALADGNVLQSGTPRQARYALGVALLDNGPYLAHLTLAETTGSVIASYPESGVPSSAQVAAWSDALRGAGSRSVWIVDDAGLALAAEVRSAGAGTRLLVASVQTEGIRATLDQIASSSRSPVVFIRDRNGRVVLAGGSVPVEELKSLHVEETESDGRYRVVLPTKSSGKYRGLTGKVTGVPGLDWEVVVLEPAGAALRETVGALRPAMAAYVAVMVLAIAVATVAFSWLVRPLRALEARARAAAQGAALEPVAVDRGDEVGRLLESFNLVTMRLNRLQEATRLLAETEEAEAVADDVARSVIHLIGPCDPAVYLMEPDEPGPARLRLVAARGAGQQAVGSVITLDEAERDDLLSPGEARTIRHGLAQRLSPASTDRESQGAALAIPLRAARGVIGMLVIARARGRFFSAAEVDLLGSFAAQAALALEKARTFEQQRAAREEAEALQRVAQLLFEESDLTAALDQVAACAAETLRMPWRLAWLDAVTVLGSEGAGSEETVRGLLSILEKSTGESDDGVEASSGLAVLSAEASDAETAAWVRSQSLSLAVAAYAKLGGRVTGLIAVGTRDDRAAPSGRDLRVAETLGRQMALALERARLFREAQERAASLETMFRVSQAVSSSLQVNVVLGRVLDVVQKILNADAVILMRWDGEKKQLHVPMARGVLDRAMLDQRFGPGEDLPGAVLQTQQAMLLSSLDRISGAFAPAAVKIGLHSGLLVPLVARGRAIGVLATLGRRQDAFDKSDADLLSTFAAHAALAIDTANLFSREHEVSRVLQASILPANLPDLDGVDLGAAYVPAGASAQIGGDYYDVFQAPDGRVVFVIADVCGKGVEAATKTSMIRFTVRGMVAAGSGPGDVLVALNRMVIESGNPNDIFTVWIGMLDVWTGVLSWADGGHPPGLMLRSGSRTIVRLGTTGPLVGALRDARYQVETVALEKGDSLLLYTDGVSEARREGRLFGEGRIRRVLRKAADVRSVPEAVLAELERFSDGDLRDDVAILAARYTGAAV